MIQRMNISDTFYVALCMTVLILGVVYWFWTQNQYIQRKMNLLENIVYEMKTLLSANEALQAPSFPDSAPKSDDAVPSDVKENEYDELHTELSKELEAEAMAAAAASMMSSASSASSKLATPVPTQHESIDNAIASFAVDRALEEPIIDSAPLSDDVTAVLEVFDLQPGGVGSGVSNEQESDQSVKGTSLDSMTLSELRRLAEQRNILGSSKLRKQQLIDTLRNAPFTTQDVTL